MKGLQGRSEASLKMKFHLLTAASAHVPEVQPAFPMAFRLALAVPTIVWASSLQSVSYYLSPTGFVSLVELRLIYCYKHFIDGQMEIQWDTWLSQYHRASEWQRKDRSILNKTRSTPGARFWYDYGWGGKLVTICANIYRLEWTLPCK